MPEPILVTGATGLVGNNVVRQFQKCGRSVRVLIRESSDKRPLAGVNVERCFGDVRDAASVSAAMRGCWGVVHAAAMVQIGWSGKQQMWEINVDGTRHVARAAREAGVRMVHISSVDALGTGSRDHPVDEDSPYTPRTPCPYALTKREAELAVQREVQAGLDAVIVNPSFMLGPWDWKPSSGRMLLEVARRKPPFAPRAANDFTHVADVAAAVIAAADRAQSGARYLLTGEHYDYLTAFRVMADICGVRGPIADVGPMLLYAAGWFGDIKARLTGKEGDINTAAIRLMREPHFYSSAKATAELDYRPRGLKQAAADAWEWFQENGFVRAS